MLQMFSNYVVAKVLMFRVYIIILLKINRINICDTVYN